jgi:AcrR family transcriptional regulator
MVPEVGLRERKKRQTRTALIDAALELFLRQGYEHTTVDQIAEAVEVSQRTFFRYFAGKEDLLAYYMGTAEETLIAALTARPAGEPPFVAAAEAFRAFFRFFGEAGPEERERFDRTRRVLEAEPTLLWAHHTRMGQIEQRLATVLAERMGVDPAVDPRPRIVVAMVGGAVRVGFTGPPCDDAVISFVRQVEQALTLAEQMLSPAWHACDPGPVRAGARLA